MRVRACTAGFAAALAALLLSSPGAAAGHRVKIEAAQFDPAIVVIPPGEQVEWRNLDSRPRALAGDFTSPAIAAGKSFKRRFRHLGRYEYRDRDNRAITGTVIVTRFGTGRPPPYPPPDSGDRQVVHEWRGTLRIDLREHWKYMDGKFRSFEGPCNAEVGEGDRAVTFAESFPEVRYRRIGSLEILRNVSEPHRIPRYHEQIDAKASDPGSGRSVDCPDGSTDPPPDVRHRCNHDYSGKRVKATLGWSPRIGQGRFFWSHDYLSGGIPFDANCGDSFLAAGSLVGLDPDQLPFDPGAGDKLLYDAGRTSPVTLAEARALRNGRPVTISRSIELHFTTDCCVPWTEPDKPTTYVRVGARYEVFGELTIRLRPR